MRDQSCAPRQSLVSAPVNHNRAPAKGLAVAPEACLEEGTESPHCLVCSREACETRRRGTTRCSARTLLVCSASTQQTHNATGGRDLWLSMSLHKRRTDTHARLQFWRLSTCIYNQRKSRALVCVSVCVSTKERHTKMERGRATCRFCRLSSVKCNSNTSSPQGPPPPFRLTKDPFCLDQITPWKPSEKKWSHLHFLPMTNVLPW